MSAIRTRLEYARVGPVLARTWNVAHGRTTPETHATHLEHMVRLISEDAPAIVCLQELPVWSLPHLESWSGLRAFGARTMRALGGPLARSITSLDPDRLRSGLTGQANAILVGQPLEPAGEGRSLVLNPPEFRSREAAALRLGPSARRAWGRNRRAAQAVRVSSGQTTVLILNLHLTGAPDSRLAEAELRRALRFADAVARPGEPLVLCGDLNLTSASSLLVERLPQLGFSPPGRGIDHILARGLRVSRGPEPWPDERRRLGEVLLSDHPPVEAEMMWP
jgi:endonuclease/exonuclease/phosphatase family metal-dependent hydrolase